MKSKYISIASCGDTSHGKGWIQCAWCIIVSLLKLANYFNIMFTTLIIMANRIDHSAYLPTSSQ